MEKRKFLVKNKIFGVITYRNVSISSFIIVENIDRELRELFAKGLVSIEDYIEKPLTEVNKANNPEKNEINKENEEFVAIKSKKKNKKDINNW